MSENIIDSDNTFTLSVAQLDKNILPSDQLKLIIKSDGTVSILNDFTISQFFPQSIEASSLFADNDPLQSTQLDSLLSDSITSKPPEPIIPHQPTILTTYTCIKCNESFRKIALYRKHMLTHKNVRKYKCNLCASSYNVETNYTIHMALHSDGKPTCPICNVSFQRSASLKSHLLVHQVEELYKCDECLAEFDKEEDYNKHLQQSHVSVTPKVEVDGSSYICSYCKWQFQDGKKYREHIRRHIKVKKIVGGKKSRRVNLPKVFYHVCGVCDKSFSKASLLERHSRIHTGERPYICDICGHGFCQKGTLKIHKNKHEGMKPFHCTLCPAKFNQKGNLRVHVNKTHVAPQPGIKVFKCTQCTCIFKKIASLNVHMTRTHPTSNPMEEIEAVTKQIRDLSEKTQCVSLGEKNRTDGKNSERSVEANATFVKLAENLVDGSIRRYVVKQKIVGDVRYYHCDKCTRTFKKPSDLIRHIRVHTKEKPYECKFCTARFALKSTLYCHSKRHSTSPTYSCTICQKKFATIRLLSFHSKVHLKFECSMCKKTFSSMQKRKQHYKETHLNEKSVEDSPKSDNFRFQCKNCDATFSRLAQLNRHLLNHTSSKSFACKECGKRFMSSSILKRHLNTHLSIGEKEKKKNEHKLSTVDDNEMISNFFLDKRKRDKVDETLIENQMDSTPLQLYQINGNTMQLVTNQENSETAEKDDEDGVTYYTICNNIELADTLLAQVKIQDNDTMLFNTINEMQDNVYSIGPINQEFDQTNINQIFNINTLIPNPANELDKVITKQTSQEKINAKGNVTLDSANLADNILTPSAGIDLNSLFNLEPDFSTNNELPGESLNLPELPEVNTVSDVEPEEKNEEMKPFACKTCDKAYRNKTALTKHVKTHKMNFKSAVCAHHQCTFCVKAFKKYSDLIRHIRTHTGEKPFECTQCNKKFTLKSTLLSHEKTHSPVSHKNHNCVVCNTSFSSKASLKVHMSIHTGARPYECNFCKMKFRTSAHRKTHESAHHLNPTKKKPQKDKVTNLLASVALEGLNQIDDQQSLEPPQMLNATELIDNVFVSQDQMQLADVQINILNETIQANPGLEDDIQLEPLILSSNFLIPNSDSIIQIGDGMYINLKSNDVVEKSGEKVPNEKNGAKKEKRFECDICHKFYASKDVLRKHKKLHGVNRKFPCSKCDRGYDVIEELQRHERTHGGEQPFKCCYCKNSFLREANLLTHLIRIHYVASEEYHTRLKGHCV